MFSLVAILTSQYQLSLMAFSFVYLRKVVPEYCRLQDRVPWGDWNLLVLKSSCNVDALFKFSWGEGVEVQSLIQVCFGQHFISDQDTSRTAQSNVVGSALKNLLLDECCSVKIVLGFLLNNLETQFSFLPPEVSSSFLSQTPVPSGVKHVSLSPMFSWFNFRGCEWQQVTGWQLTLCVTEKLRDNSTKSSYQLLENPGQAGHPIPPWWF